MSIDVSVVSRNVVAWDYINYPDTYFDEYIGDIPYMETEFAENLEKNKNIKLLPFIGPSDHAIFNQKQIRKLSIEIKLPLIRSNVNPLIVAVIKKGIHRALQLPESYLKFEI